MILSKRSSPTIRQFLRKRFLFPASSIQHRRLSPWLRTGCPGIPGQPRKGTETQKQHRVIVRCCSMFLPFPAAAWAYVVPLSGSAPASFRRSAALPSRGKYTVPCHSCFSAAVTAISNRGVCFMLRVLSCLTALVGLVSSASLYGDFTTKSTAFLLPVSGCETGNARGSSRGHRLCSLTAACTLQILPVLDIQLFQHLGNISLDGVWRNIHVVCDLLIVHPRAASMAAANSVVVRLSATSSPVSGL